MNNLGQILKKAREQKCLSLADVTNMVGITDSRLSRIENGKAEEPSPYALYKLAKLYEINLIDLYIEAKYLDKEDLFSSRHVLKYTELLSSEEKEEIQKEINQMIAKRQNLPTVFRLGELFCGPGGLAWGAVNAKISDQRYSITHAWANDYDAETCATYRHNICPKDAESVYCADIRTFDLSQLRPIDALAFGFPCNDYSIVGEQKGIDGTFGPLYSYGVKALKLFKPLWFLAENVGGLQTANEGKAFTKILQEMKDANYNIVPHLYKFEQYGVPQARHRVIIIGIRKDLNVQFKVPSPKPYEGLDNTCKTAIEVPRISGNAANNELTRQSENVIKRLMHIKPGQNAFTADLPQELRLNVLGAKISQIYKRLDPKKPAYTVTGSGGGGTHIYHWEEPRALTNRERARLQTFTDDFEFMGSKESVRKQIGMAVPCRGAQIIFEAVLKSFAGIDYESIAANISEE